MSSLIFIFTCISLASFDFAQSVQFECHFKTGKWGTLGIIYYCAVKYPVNITSLEEAYIDSISGSHLSGHNNNNLEAFDCWKRGNIQHFPRGLENVFKNLRGIEFYSTGMKEIHQSDLKPFPKLENLILHENQLEVLEEDLFEFNPNLNYLYLASNIITHIDPNVFEKLTKLNYLQLVGNICINISAGYNITAVQNVIKLIKSQCLNSVYSNLEQKVKNLRTESKFFNSEDLKQKIYDLESEVKNSKFPDYFQSIFEELKNIQTKKIQNEFPEKFNAQITAMNEKIENLNQKISKMDENSSKFTKNTGVSLKVIESSHIESFAAIMKVVEEVGKKMEILEENLVGMDKFQVKLISKVHKMESEIKENFGKLNQKLKSNIGAE